MLRRVIPIILVLVLVLTPTLSVRATDLGGSWAQATAYITKEFGLDLVARGIARNLLNELASGLIEKIQGGGRNGGPAFVQNWRNFQTDAQYRGENVFRSLLAGTKLCNYFSGDLKGLFGANQKINAPGQNLRVGNFDPFTLRANCTLPNNFNLTNYQNDFAGNGGWDAWSRLLEPQNNYYGTLFSSLDEANKQRALEESGDINEALAGSGYTSVRDSCVGEGAGAKCTFLGKVFTPGDLLGKTAASTIDADLQWLVSSDELSEVLINIVQASINRLSNLALTQVRRLYTDAPGSNDSKTDAFNQCSSGCGGDAQCLLQCSQNASELVPNPELPQPEPEPGSGNGSGGPCASQEEIDNFLENNPGDEGRLAEAFPC